MEQTAIGGLANQPTQPTQIIHVTVGQIPSSPWPAHTLTKRQELPSCTGSYSVPRTPNKSRGVNGLARWPLYIHTFNGLSCSLDSEFERMGLSHSYSRQAVEVNGLRLANWLIHTYVSQVLFDGLGKCYLLFHLHAALVQFI